MSNREMRPCPVCGKPSTGGYTLDGTPVFVHGRHEYLVGSVRPEWWRDEYDLSYTARLSHIPHAWGVYCITNTATGEQYVGQASDMHARCKQHLSGIMCAHHPNDRIRQAVEAYHQHVFEFSVLEIAEPRSDLLALERKYIDLLKPVYNIALPATGGEQLAVTIEKEDLAAMDATGMHRSTFIRMAVKEKLERMRLADE